MIITRDYRLDITIWRLVAVNVFLGVIGLTSFLNGLISFSFSLTFAAAIIKIYRLDPEPFFLISLHMIVSYTMLQDVPTILAVIASVFAACATTNSLNVSFERIAVFLTSMALSFIQWKVIATAAAIVFVLVIIAIKLRPFRLAVNFVLVLLLLAISVPVSCYVTASLSAAFILILTIGYFTLQESDYFQDRSDEFLHHDAQYNPLCIRKVNSGATSLMQERNVEMPTESVNLLGHTVTSALTTLLHVLREHEKTVHMKKAGGSRYLKVITGDNDQDFQEDNMNLVKPTVANFLKVNKYRFQVIPNRPEVLIIDLDSHIK